MRVAKLGSQDNSGKATYFSSRYLWRARKNKKEKKEAVRPNMVRTANPEPLNPETPMPRGTEMASLLQGHSQ